METAVRKAEELGNRMKVYEDVTRTHLTPKQPVMVRIDGHNFSTFTTQKWVNWPYDERIIMAFRKSVLKVCDEVPNILFAYHQSDEVTFFLKDYRSQNDIQYFKGNVQKISSLFASKFTKYFNWFLAIEVAASNPGKMSNIKLAEFDARCWSLPKEEVVNNFIWRQRDWEKNSVTGHFLTMFSHNQSMGLHTHQKKEMCASAGQDWDKLPNYHRRGTAFRKVQIEIPVKELPEGAIKALIKAEIQPNDTVLRNKWIFDTETPRFEDDKNYIEQYVF